MLVVEKGEVSEKGVWKQGEVKKGDRVGELKRAAQCGDRTVHRGRRKTSGGTGCCGRSYPQHRAGVLIREDQTAGSEARSCRMAVMSSSAWGRTAASRSPLRQGRRAGEGGRAWHGAIGVVVEGIFG